MLSWGSVEVLICVIDGRSCCCRPDHNFSITNAAMASLRCSDQHPESPHAISSDTRSNSQWIKALIPLHSDNLSTGQGSEPAPESVARTAQPSMRGIDLRGEWRVVKGLGFRVYGSGSQNMCTSLAAHEMR